MTSSSNIYSPQDPEKSFIWFPGFYHVLLSSKDIHAQSVEGFGGERLRISDIKRTPNATDLFTSWSSGIIPIALLSMTSLSL